MSGKSGCSISLLAIMFNASSNNFENTFPPKGGANQRARIKRDSLIATSSCASFATVLSTAPPRRRKINQAIGVAQNLVKRDSGRASGSSNMSTSAISSHMSVNGSKDWPVTIACDRKMPLMPPALDPAMMSVKTRSFTPLTRDISVSKS